MFEDLLGNSEKMQADLIEKLKTIEYEEAKDGVTIKANANRDILSITLEDGLFSIDHKEQLEDLLVILLNRLAAKTKEVEQNESQKSMKELLPPGFENLFG